MHVRSYLPFLVMIISVPTELNCFHKEAFSRSILTSSFWGLAPGSLETAFGASILGGRALAATSQAEGSIGTCAGASRSKKLKRYENDEKRVRYSSWVQMFLSSITGAVFEA